MRAWVMAVMLLAPAPRVAAAQGADEAAVARDLTAVIALQGLPCGRVVSARRLGDNDYAVTCQDGNRYRVTVREGRVVVEKQ